MVRRRSTPGAIGSLPPSGPSAKSSRRRQRRYAFPLPVLVVGFTTGDRLFKHLGFTRNVSKTGCCIHLPTKPDITAGLALSILPREELLMLSEPVLYEIAWARADGCGWEVGAEVLESPGVLDLAFPGILNEDHRLQSRSKARRSVRAG